MGQEKERRSKRAGGEVKGEGAKNKLNSKDKFVFSFQTLVKVRGRRPLSSFLNLQQCKTHQKKKSKQTLIPNSTEGPCYNQKYADVGLAFVSGL